MEKAPRHAHETPAAAPPNRGGRVLGFAVITVSDTRTPETDASGALARSLLEEAGHRVAAYRIVPDEVGPIREAIRDALALDAVHIVVLTGGTGISPRDRTHDAVAGEIETALPGFGELFRSLSFAEIGSATILSRASAGVARGKSVFSLPGSRGAVKLGLERIVIPEASHVVAELGKRG